MRVDSILGAIKFNRWPISTEDIPQFRGILISKAILSILCLILFLTPALNSWGFAVLFLALTGGTWFSLQSLQPLLMRYKEVERALVLALENLPENTSAAMQVREAAPISEATFLLAEISQDIASLNDALENIAITIDNLAQGSRTQATALSQMINVITQAAASIAAAAEKSLAAAEKATTAVKITGEGQEHMQHLVMMVTSIEENARKIAAVNEMISKISGKTNMLSLNASLEAARVGVQGRGFAVVAEAVRKLAANTATQAEEIGELTKTATEGAQAGFRTAAAIGSDINNLASEISKVSQEIITTAEIIKKEREVMENLSGSVGDISFTSEMNAMMAEEVNNSVREISATIVNMQAKLNRFKEEAANEQ